ncbi:MAG TPA: hypothetical protein VJH23_00140 [archaeon]|nr:hypothetical protein [archaeon]
MAYPFGDVLGSVYIVGVLFIFIWIFGWTKENLGSAKLAILFAIIVVYLTFFSYDFLFWVLLAFFLLQTLGKEFISQINPFGGDQLR